MGEDDIKKTVFRARSSGLYQFTHMPFGLSNAGSSFCCLMEQCLGDQQFVTFLLYLDNKIKGQRKEKPAAKENPIETKELNWMLEHQQAFNTLKEALVTAPVLGYPGFNREFLLETDASLQGLGAMLSQQDETGKLHVIACAS